MPISKAHQQGMLEIWNVDQTSPQLGKKSDTDFCVYFLHRGTGGWLEF